MSTLYSFLRRYSRTSNCSVPTAVSYTHLVLIYATSNRRHLIRESWRDRSESQDDVYRDDSMNETISLSDRFGLIIQYYAPDQKEYLAIIDHMLRKEGILSLIHI